MKIELAYGSGRLALDVPDSCTLDTFAPAAARPITADRFRKEFSRADGNRWCSVAYPLIVVNDGYRRTPTAQILTWLETVDSTLLDRARFLVSTGSHPAPTDPHYRAIFGPHLERVRNRVAYHDATDRSALVRLGSDPRGGEVYVNRALTAADAVIAIGSVEPHYFAGFTGGRKSVFPGLIDLATIERNHNLANSLEAAPLRLQGNPVAEHLAQLTGLLDIDTFFTIQAVLDANDKMAGVFCGPMTAAFEQAVVLARDIYAHQVSKRYDLVLAEMRPPLDRNLYQLQKGVENCRRAVADGGALVAVSACEEGIGSPHFFSLARDWDRRKNRPRNGPVRFGSHKLSRVIETGRRIELLVYSALRHEDIRRVFYEPLDNLQEFLYSRQNACEKCNVAVVYDAGHTVLES